MNYRPPQAVPTLAERQRPGLSETLTGPRHPERCQCCGAAPDGRKVVLGRWIECDEWDKPTPKSPVVVLCEKCAHRLIEPHPRMYHALQMLEPWPGASEICIGCALRDGTRCTSPSARANGGEGIFMGGFRGTRCHINAGRNSGFRTLYTQGATTCTGRKTA